MKFEWRKYEKNLYGAKIIPALVNIPSYNFIMIKGSGNPNYKSAAAKNILSDGIHDFTVYPLEGVWKLKNTGTKSASSKLIKENLEYTIMIRQPDFITEDMAYAALERIKIKKPHHMYEKIIFDTIHDGKCVEILHVGSYDNEPSSFGKMYKFTEENGLKRITDCHREIYLSNRTKTDKLKTILRYKVN